jgi:putative inorganic carbon (hco3(-)) transporter
MVRVERFMNFVRRWWDTTFGVEMLLLLLAAPLLYFPARFGEAGLIFGIGLLAAGWLWRRVRLGYWLQRTPADWPIFFLFFVMLPVAVWAAPDPLRQEYAIPRALILIWNFCLFWTIVSHASRTWMLNRLILGGFLGCGILLALVLPFGLNWRLRFPGADRIIGLIPTPLAGRIDGAALGFDSNQSAGVLLFILPLVVALAVHLVQQRRWRSPLTWLLAFAASWTGLLILGTQSRAGILGLGVGLLVMALMIWPWGRRILLIGGPAFVLALPVLPLDRFFNRLDDAEIIASMGGTATLTGFRVEVWQQAITALHDFSFTGMGLGTFRKVIFLLYPTSIPPTYDIAHAHNFWLQSGLDFGLPGLIALLALYLLIINTLRSGWHTFPRPLVIGLWGCLVAQSTYSLFDSVSMGSKPNLFFWSFCALIFALGHSYQQSAEGDRRLTTDY